MTDHLLRIALSNVCVSLALAIVAVVVGATVKRPHLTNLLWLLVLVKLVTPPVVTIPVVTVPAEADTAIAAEAQAPPPPLPASSLEVDADPRSDSQSGPWEHADTEQAASPLSSIATVLQQAKPWLLSIWLLVSVAILACSSARIRDFGRLLAARSEVAPQHVQAAASSIADRLKLRTVPAARTTSTRISPMVWWTGGRVQIVIPTTLLDQMDEKQWRWVLAHELAHVKRRDYMVRWLEWLACVCFWWDPVVWWAQRNLRATEEICCDALVMSGLKPGPHSYVDSLMTAVEFLACPAFRPPAMASEINSGGSLERRFRMIESGTPHRSNSRWVQACVVLLAVAVLPLGLAYAKGPDREAVGRRLRAAVQAGELTAEQARTMLGTLGKTDGAKKDQHPDRARADALLKAIWARLQAAVKAGKMSEEDAHKKMGEIKKGIHAKLKGKDARRDDRDDRAQADALLKAIWARLQAAVKAGKMSEEDAHKKMGEIKKGIHAKLKGKDARRDDRDDRAREHLMKLRRELGAAVEAGKMSREDAAKKMAGAEKAVRERMAAGRGQTRAKRITKEDLSHAGIEIRKAVAAGKITAEQGRAKMEALRKMAGQPTERGAEKHATRKPTRPDWEGIKARIEGAVKRGDITREQADAKYKEIKERMGGRRER